MHPSEAFQLLTNVSELSLSAKVLLAYLRGHTNGTLNAVVQVDEVLVVLGISSLGSLRRIVNVELDGWVRGRIKGGQILDYAIEPWVVERYERAEMREEGGTNAQICATGTVSEGAKRAEMREAGSGENAQKCAKRAEMREMERGDSPRGKREKRKVSPPTPPHKELVKYGGGAYIPSASVGGAGGDDRPRTEALLTHLGLSPRQAEEVAGRLAFDEVVRHVASWQLASRRGEFFGLGALLLRFREWPVPPLPSAEALQDGVLEQFVRDEDLDVWGVERPRDPMAGYDAPKDLEGIIRH